MATVVPFASCYGSGQPLYLFGRAPRGSNYLSLFTYRGPRCAPRPRMAHHPPKMTLQQICRLLKVMKQVRKREAAVAAAACRKQGSMALTPAAEKKCPRHKRSLKRVG